MPSIRPCCTLEGWRDRQRERHTFVKLLRYQLNKEMFFFSVNSDAFSMLMSVINVGWGSSTVWQKKKKLNWNSKHSKIQYTIYGKTWNAIWKGNGKLGNSGKCEHMKILFSRQLRIFIRFSFWYLSFWCHFVITSFQHYARMSSSRLTVFTSICNKSNRTTMRPLGIYLIGISMYILNMIHFLMILADFGVFSIMVTDGRTYGQTLI